jgi:hypothetical protein
MPPTVICPYCQETAALLSTVSSISFFDYYLCDTCSRLSERPKGTAGPPVPLTALQDPNAPATDPPIPG